MDKFVKEIAKTLHLLVWSVLMMVVYAWVGMGGTALAQTVLELDPANASAVNGPTTAPQTAMSSTIPITQPAIPFRPTRLC